MIPKWQKIEEDLIARGIIPVTFNWTLREKYYFYAHGCTINMEDGSFVTSHAIREAADRIDTAVKAIVEGTLKPDGEKNKLTYALRTPDHEAICRWSCDVHS